MTPGQGTILGAYRIIRPLGEGGMGTVYEAAHVQTGAPAAIKVLHPHHARNPEIAARFFNEARAANAIRHPSIVPVFDVGTDAEGTPYLVMGLLSGQTLTARIEVQQRLGIDALRIGRQIASALAAAHAQGIIHRDLKPDNVMLVPDAEAQGGERVKILDFGIAKLAPAGEGMRHTRTGMMLGTPQYMAPEQCRGAGSVEASADVYSLGVMLYEMLTGNPPFMATGGGELMALHMFHEPPPLEGVDPGVPAELPALVLLMLAKQAAARPTMAQVERTLEQLGSPQVLLQAGAAMDLRAMNLNPTQTRTRTNPSTLGGAPGQQVAQTGATEGRRGGPGVALALGAVASVVVVAAVLWPRSPSPGGQAAATPSAERPTPAAVPPSARPPVQPAVVQWELRSEPPGATVLRDGIEVGTTPWGTAVGHGDAQVEFVLRYEGYLDRTVTLSATADDRRTEKLEPVPRKVPTPSRPSSTGVGGGPSTPKTSDYEPIVDDDGVVLMVKRKTPSTKSGPRRNK